MKTVHQPLRARYVQALRRFLDKGDEVALQGAYELGRQALTQGTGLLEMAALHHEAMARLQVGADPKDLASAASFLRECLSPFEMTQRGFGEAVEALKARAEELRSANSSLSELNATLEAKVAERTRDLEEKAQELARSNGELQQFVLVASHDLKEPLRMINSFVQLLQMRFPENLDSQAHEYIRYAVEGAHRIQQLIEDLLSYTRLGAQGLSVKECDLEKCLREALSNLRMTVEDTGARISHTPLPKIQADPSQMGLLLQNLIGNALKFRGAEPPQVHVFAGEEPTQWTLGIRDNGIGIDPMFFEKIFVVFQRLHPRDQYPGTGIGLSLCRKIVEQHGGRIWVESEPGKGTTFYFTLPKRKKGEARDRDRKDPSEDL